MLKETLVNNWSLSNDQFPKNKNRSEEPSNLSWWQLLWKTLIWLIIWWIISAILFIALSFSGKIFIDAFQQTGEIVRTNPILPFLLLFIGFLWTFIGNIWVAGSYNLFFNKKYRDISKMFGLLLLTNAILFFILVPIYIVFSKQVDTLFIILWFHVFFSIFVSACQIEFLSNPNYSASALMWNVLWFALSLLIYSIVWKSSWDGSIQNKVYLLILIPAIVWYALIPFGSWIWEKIYYKVYENWSNPLFISSNEDEFNIDETTDMTGEDDQTNVEI